MPAIRVSNLANWLLALAALLLAAAPASAAPPRPGDYPDGDYGTRYSRCFADGTPADNLAQIAQAERRWTCGEASHSIVAERVVARFQLAEGTPPPGYLETRRAALKAIEVLVLGADGSTRAARYTPDDLQTSRRGGYIRVPLPAAQAPARQVFVAFDDPTHRMTLEQAQLVPANAHDHQAGRVILLVLAALCGTLLMPLMFNAAFYRILRERFVLWHSALAISLLLSIVVSSGLAYYLAGLSVMFLNAANTALFGLSVGAAGMFAHSFIEPGRLDPRLRRALPLAAAWAVLISLLHASFPFVLRPIQSTLYYWAYIPVLVTYVWMLADALQRRSRAVRYQAIGWAPMIVVGVIRLASGLLPSVPSADAMLLFYIGCVVEVMATTLGVADRFMAIKDERNRAQLEARVLGELSERDPLTGLMNRRAIERRFRTLYREGFDTVAVLDLDHFKSINDRYGHAVGDEVLRACAGCLGGVIDQLAIRMGGEEFLILMRGRNALQRAENVRRELSEYISGEVEALESPVTASMGVVQLARSFSRTADFDVVYERADKLLYEAKATGRNRTMSEKLSLFVAPERSRAAA
ncbi:MAG: diguanylate cyclase [Croceibacterium sp.]